MSCAENSGQAKKPTLSHMILDWKVPLHTKLMEELNLCILTEYLVTQKFLQSISARAAFQSPFDLTSAIQRVQDISYQIGHHHGSLDCMWITEKFTCN